MLLDFKNSTHFWTQKLIVTNIELSYIMGKLGVPTSLFTSDESSLRIFTIFITVSYGPLMPNKTLDNLTPPNFIFPPPLL